ncbi:response regulator transcription factor [Caldanaerobius polysaccharolyticus]|uniref:response regulator transcription factor n=1 Tax=Caldanaerobius polysaccharolyticus TaxID=44256 RepID=UPI00047AD391|nr:response regulator [Caldanaerobius polysaccharolyticus]
MYKLLLVDDEEEVRKGIINKIQWEKYGFDVVAEAENGWDALDVAEKIVPDVVITDIKMPFMDGIKLAELLRDKYPTAKIIILTGYDEFEYAQKAIKLNVMDYVLKPVSSKELVDVLVKVKAQIDDEIAQKQDIQALREHYRKSLPVLREKFLTSLVMGKLGKNEILERSHNYGVDLNGSLFVVSVVSIDNMVESAENLGFVLPEDSELLSFALLNICEEVVDKYGLGIVFLNDEKIVIITVSDQNDKYAVMDRTFSALEEIKKSVEKFLKFTVTIGVGTVCGNTEGISDSYRQALSALDYKLVLGNNRVIWIEDIEPHCENKVVFDDEKERMLTSCIRVGTHEEVEGIIEKLFDGIDWTKVSIDDYKVYLMEIMTAILKTAAALNLNTEEVFGSNFGVFNEMYKFDSIRGVKEWLKNICVKIMNCISNDRKSTYKLLVEKAKEYAQNHYSESDITIDKICKFLHISPTYFSFIFKKETKMTYMNYLLQIRMNVAKELLKTTNMKVFEIAEKVGYPEPNYFSYSFKKYVGMSPTEYRNSANGEIAGVEN